MFLFFCHCRLSFNMVFSWLNEKIFKLNKTLTIDLRMARPTTTISQFHSEFLTPSTLHPWQSSISVDDDHRSQIIPTVPSIISITTTTRTTPTPTTISTDIHAILHPYINVTQIWSTFVTELLQKAQRDFWFILVLALISLFISIMIMFSLIKLLNYLPTNCSFQSQSFSTHSLENISVQLR